MLNLFGSVKTNNSQKDYKNYRWFFTSNGTLVVGGKSDEQNELAINNFSKPEYTVLHTTEPGSPFMIIQNESPDKTDIEEAAVFCGCFSKQWKKSPKKISIDVFKGSQIYKSNNMKAGTFGVKGDKKTIQIKPQLNLIHQKGRLRAVPKEGKETILAKISPGKMSKEEATELLSKTLRDKYNLLTNKEEIMQAIPSDNISVK
jgi:hypothetical protein